MDARWFIAPSACRRHGAAMAPCLALVALCVSISAVQAQTNVPVPEGHNSTDGSAGAEVYRLTPAEIEATLAMAAARNTQSLPALSPAAGAMPAPPAAINDGRPHGEVGMMVGTGGARAVWGSTIVPLGRDGVAAFSFSTGRWPGAPY